MNTTGIWSDKLRLSGKPCIRGHRFSMAQFLAELADRGSNVKSVLDNFDIDYDSIKVAWEDLINELGLLKINSKHIMSDSETRGGENCLQGHRVPISMLLMDLLESENISTLAEDRDLEVEEVEGMLWDLASLLDRDWTEGPPKDIEKAIREGPT